MKHCGHSVRFLLLLGAVAAAGFLLGGCGEPGRHPLLLKAEQCRKAGDFIPSCRHLEAYLKRYPNSTRAILLLAAIYDENLDDPLRAAFYYRTALDSGKLAGDDQESIKRFLEENERKWSRKISVAQINSAEKEELLRLRKENSELLRRLEKFAERPVPETASAPAEEKAPPQPSPPQRTKVADAGTVMRYHTIQRGDSLSSIARKYYGNSMKFAPILEANRLSEKSRLKVGSVLLIPPLPR
ncbi:MAG: LysM peptidoglycan-binding domain-containing protein [Victivallaceae bacterium]|nr:LysM peptidoglycan-binding domain-containing protein [Victivallaceae bacterium]